MVYRGTWKFLVDWNNDGQYDHALSDITDDVIRWSIAFGGEGITELDRPRLLSARGRIRVHGNRYVAGYSVLTRAQLATRHAIRITYDTILVWQGEIDGGSDVALREVEFNCSAKHDSGLEGNTLKELARLRDDNGNSVRRDISMLQEFYASTIGQEPDDDLFQVPDLDIYEFFYSGPTGGFFGRWAHIAHSVPVERSDGRLGLFSDTYSGGDSPTEVSPAELDIISIRHGNEAESVRNRSIFTIKELEQESRTSPGATAGFDTYQYTLGLGINSVAASAAFSYGDPDRVSNKIFADFASRGVADNRMGGTGGYNYYKADPTVIPSGVVVAPRLLGEDVQNRRRTLQMGRHQMLVPRFLYQPTSTVRAGDEFSLNKPFEREKLYGSPDEWRWVFATSGLRKPAVDVTGIKPSELFGDRYLEISFEVPELFQRRYFWRSDVQPARFEPQNVGTTSETIQQFPVGDPVTRTIRDMTQLYDDNNSGDYRVYRVRTDAPTTPNYASSDNIIWQSGVYAHRFEMLHTESAGAPPRTLPVEIDDSINAWGVRDIEYPDIYSDGQDARLEARIQALSEPREEYAVDLDTVQDTSVQAQTVMRLEPGDYIALIAEDEDQNIDVSSICLITSVRQDYRETTSDDPIKTIICAETGNTVDRPPFILGQPNFAVKAVLRTRTN